MERGVKELELNLSLYAYEPLVRPVYLDPFGCYAQSSSARGMLSLSLTALIFQIWCAILWGIVALKLGALLASSILHSSSNTWRYHIAMVWKQSQFLLAISILLYSVSMRKMLNLFPFLLLNEVSFSEAYAAHLIHNFPSFSSQLSKVSLAIYKDSTFSIS